MSTGDENSLRLYDNDEDPVGDAIGPSAESRERAADAPPAGATPASHPGAVRSLASRRRGGRAEAAGSGEPLRTMHPEFRTTVPVGELTVTGVLPRPARLPVGAIAICGDVQRLTCDQALELADALLLVVLRMDSAAEERYGTANRDRED